MGRSACARTSEGNHHFIDKCKEDLGRIGREVSCSPGERWSQVTKFVEACLVVTRVQLAL